jgi:D-alanyl-D-alanine carboxypeptidase
MLPLIAPLAFADPIDTIVKRELTRTQCPGMTVAVVRDGKLVTKRAYGLADIELGDKMRLDDLFEVGSITKQFTAFLALLLVQDGKLNLDASIAEYVDGAPEAWKPIKVRNLLNQNSGLPEYVQIPGLGLMDTFERAHWLEVMKTQPLDFPADTAWAYSNTNYALMGLVIEKVGGKPYTEQLTERVLTPLAMTNTRFQDVNAIWPRRAHGIIRQGTEVMRVAGMGGSIQSDGTLVSNLSDMVKWDAALRERKLLKPEGYAELWKPGKLANGLEKPYGMGWFLTAPDGPAYVGHAGASVGYSGGIARFKDGQKGSISVIVLCNQYAVQGEELGKSIALALDPSLKFPIPAATPDPDPSRTARLREVMGHLAANKATPAEISPSVSGPLGAWRTRSGSPYATLANVKTMAFAREDSLGRFKRLTYRLDLEKSKMTAYLTLDPEGKVAAIQLRPDPQ